MVYKQKTWSGYQNSPVKQEVTIPFARPKESDDYEGVVPKERLRPRQNPKGGVSTHLMASDIMEENKETGELQARTKGPYHVWASITEDPESGEYKDQNPSQAFENKEYYTFDNLEEAQAFEEGSWKDEYHKRLLTRPELPPNQKRNKS